MKAWFLRQLSRGTEPETDPDALTYLATAHTFEAALLAESLRANGIEASYHESTNPATRSLTNATVYVRQHQLLEARKFLDNA